MGLSMKDRYARLDMSKLPESYKSEFDEMEKSTYGFTDEELNDVFTENFNDMYELVEKKYPDALKKGGTVKKVKSAKVKTIKPKKSEEHEEKKEESEEHNKLTTAQKLRIQMLEKKGFKKDEKLSGFEKESDGTEYYVFHSQHGMGVAMIQADGQMEGNLSGYFPAYKNKSEEDIDAIERNKASRKEKAGETDIIMTRDDKEVDRKSRKNIGKTFYEENGKAWKCKGYNEKLKECIFEDSDGKEISACLKDMYTSNPVKKREKGNLVDDCKDTLKEAGFTVREHKAGGKKIKRSEPRPEKTIIKERVEDTFTPILKDLQNSEEKEKENKGVIEALEECKLLFTKLFNRLSNMADDGKEEAIRKLVKLLREIVD
jgi:hypothetical protein